jgi:hydrogenase maturation protease
MFKTPNQKAPILILGVGNILQTDDGVGVHVIDQMAGLSFPDEVELFDGGTAGLDLLSIIENRDQLIVIDAVDGGMKPGTIFRFTPDDIACQQNPIHSLHQIGLIEALRLAKLNDRAPEKTLIIGVQPGEIDWGIALSRPLRKRLPKIITIVKDEIAKSLADLNPNKRRTCQNLSNHLS